MEAVVDKIVEELKELEADTDEGVGSVVDFEAIYWGDPGVIPVANYPCITVQPVTDRPVHHTTGWQTRELRVLVTFLIDARSYFDASVDEANGDRLLVDVVERMRRWFQRDSNKTLDEQSGVEDVQVSSAEYLVQRRDSVIAKSARVELAIRKRYQRQR